MLRNYLKLAIKVLGRRKFFTFISLFGISFTLMILMLITSFLQVELGNNAPMSKRDKMVFIPNLILKKIQTDTILTIDTSYIDGTAVYDTTSTEEDRQSSWSNSSVSFPFLDRYMREIQGASDYTFYSKGHTFDLFINSNKLTLEAIYADDQFWRVFDFNFLEGGPFRKQQVDNQEQVAIITLKTRDAYFGKGATAMGKELVLDDKHLTVIGVVEKVLSSSWSLDAGVYMPYTHMNPRNFEGENFHGSFEAVYLANRSQDLKLIKDDVKRKSEQIQLPNPEEYNVLELRAMSFNERYSESLMRSNDPQKSYRFAYFILVGLLALFILLPTLNLINLNISRILERSSEIGVRKAFGAHSSTLLYQFVFENIVITFLGGIIGFALALVLINLINNSDVFPNTELAFNYKVFLYSLFICLGFGILSGLIPAYRMSKLQIVNALKRNEL